MKREKKEKKKNFTIKFNNLFLVDFSALSIVFNNKSFLPYSKDSVALREMSEK